MKLNRLLANAFLVCRLENPGSMQIPRRTTAPTRLGLDYVYGDFFAALPELRSFVPFFIIAAGETNVSFGESIARSTSIAAFYM